MKEEITFPGMACKIRAKYILVADTWNIIFNKVLGSHEREKCMDPPQNPTNAK